MISWPFRKARRSKLRANPALPSHFRAALRSFGGKSATGTVRRSCRNKGMQSHALLHVRCSLMVFRSPWTAPASEPGKTWMIRVSIGKGGHHVPNLQSSCAGRTQHIRARKASQCDPSTPLRRRPQRARSHQSQCVALQHRSRASRTLLFATVATWPRPVTIDGPLVSALAAERAQSYRYGGNVVLIIPRTLRSDAREAQPIDCLQAFKVQSQ